MSLFDRFRKKEVKKDLGDKSGTEEEMSEQVYSGLRVEVTTEGGLFLLAGKLMNCRGTHAELYQYTESEQSPQDQEPMRVRIRGYNDRTRKAVYMEGTISPLPKHIWKVEELTVARVGNDRAFFRLDVDLEATMTTFGGFGSGEYSCRLLNISVGGACISTDRLYHEGDKLLLKVMLMEDRDMSTMFCQVVRVIDKGEGKYEYGCRFLELTDSDEERITQSIFAAQRKKRV